ncbi:AMP-binding protein [Azospirillum sp. TSO22-1]|uniref:phenylacetate--CoA ligase family protein n=1 Tax=Azospirillum sp. TSO22-1 TaxID=716789 RepID=UPI000D60B608|nr:AMP-binding protein [Azospirillum sp. TSO22-1]PWC53441.1 AMP-dependent synthetase [Azospirillum sp. TSO22-1]
MSGEHYDTLETRDQQAREAALMAALPGHIAHAKANAPAYARLLAEVDPATVASRAALADLPVTRKSELTEMQAAEPPFGGLTGVPVSDLARIFCSPGPIFDPEGQGGDHYRTARALYASGVRKGRIVHNCFAYHFTPAGRMFEAGAHAIGCPVFPAGTGNTEQQVQVIAALKPAAYVGTPDYLKIILEKADELGVELPSLTIGHVTGGAFLPPLRTFYAERGIQVYQSYGIADLGLIAYETTAREGLVVAEEVILEIVRPGTGDPVPDGEVGEVVITVPGHGAYPLIRFATGDLSAVLPGTSPCGRTNTRIKGWMGRADQTTKVKGMFVHPRQIAEVLKRHPDVLRARLVVDRPADADTMLLKIEAVPEPGLEAAVADTLAAVTKLKGRVEIEPPGSLPNDGKVIDDVRKYE